MYYGNKTLHINSNNDPLSLLLHYYPYFTCEETDSLRDYASCKGLHWDGVGTLMQVLLTSKSLVLETVLLITEQYCLSQMWIFKELTQCDKAGLVTEAGLKHRFDFKDILICSWYKTKVKLKLSIALS